jgi:enoyl-CoA hydratase/carnithine racemase
MIKEKVEDGIAIITLSHGGTNSITLETLRQIDAVVKKVNEDDALKGIVLTGEGRFFSSGFHLPDFIGFKEYEEICKWFDEEEQLLLNYFTCKKPVVCAMNGHSAAAGLIWAFASDYRIIKNHPKIKLGMSEIKIGLPLSIAQSAVVRFGLDSDKIYRDVMYFGDMVGVDKALELGIVDEIVEEENLVARAKEIVKLWIDTPNKPFIPMKQIAKKQIAQQIATDLKDKAWQEGLRCFLGDEVRGTLEFVQATLPA